MTRSGLFPDSPQHAFIPEIRRSAPVRNWEIAHHHTSLEFNLVIAGTGAYFLADQHFELLPGTLVWILPYQHHRLMRAPDLDMWVGALAPHHFTPKMLAEVSQHPIKRLAAEDAVALDSLFSHLSQDGDSPEVYEAGMQYAVRSAIQIARNSAGPPPPVRHPAVTQALAILRADDEIANLAGLAARCGVSTNYLGDLLASQTGRGFVEWRNIARLERFQNFYPESEDLLTAALAAGFGSYTQFHRVVQDIIGTTPGNWARRRSETAPITLPKMSHARDQLSPGSQRLLWYNLGHVRFAAAGAWLAALMGGGVVPPPASSDAAAGIPTNCDDITALAPFLPKLADELVTAMPDFEVRIRAAFAENDLLQQFAGTVGLMGVDHSDFTTLAMILLATHSYIANWDMLPTQDELARLLALVRYRATLPVAAMNPALRQEIAAGLIVHATILRHAWIGARGSANNVIAAQLSDAVHDSSLHWLGLDLRKTPLYGPRSPV